MNIENLEFLRENLKYLGFGEQGVLYEELEQKIQEEVKEFLLCTSAYYDDDYMVEAALYFRKSDKNDMYFFNKYEALLRKGDMPEKDRKQTFYITKGTGITLKEAFNLLQGRAVNKKMISFEGEKYNAWVQLDFEVMNSNHNYKMNQYRDQYGFDLEKALENYPIRELKTEESKAMLLKALRRGNLQPVHFMKASRAEKMFIEANPRYKRINIYSSAMLALQNPIKKPARQTSDTMPERVGDPQNGEGPGTLEEGIEEDPFAEDEEREDELEACLNDPSKETIGNVQPVLSPLPSPKKRSRK